MLEQSPPPLSPSSSKRYKNWIIITVAIIIIAIVVSVFRFDKFITTRANNPTNPQIANSQNSTPATPIPDLNIATQTNRLLGLLNAYNNASDQAKEQALNDLVALAQQRKQSFAAAMRQQPIDAIQAALPISVRNNFPPQAQDFIEQEVALEGNYLLFHGDDFENQQFSNTHILQLDDNSEIELLPTHEEHMPNPGGKIRVNSYQLDDAAVTDTGSIDNVEILSDASPVESAPTARRVLVLPFNFENNTSQTFTPDTARSYVFADTASPKHYYEEASFNKITLSGAIRPDGDVTDWFTIPYTNTGCSTNYRTWSNAARTAAQNAGWNLSNYDHIIFTFPASDCGWGGLGSVGGTDTWIPAQYFGYSYPYRAYVIAHELGHNLRARHANSYNCTEDGQRVTIGSTCTSTVYGDNFDIMGNPQTPRHMNNFHKGQVGFLDAVNTQDVTTAGTYTITPIAQSSTGIQSLRVRRDSSNYYYVEFRQPLGYDNWNATDPVFNGVTIRLAPDYSIATQSQLLDATPNTSSFTDAALAVGQSFTDPVTGTTITTQSIESTGATVAISFNCIHTDPTVTLSPTSQWGSPGQNLDYNLTIRNNDSNSCPASNFNITTNTPSDWTHATPADSGLLAPGNSVSKIVTITPNNAATEGLYQFTATATNSTDSSATSSATANYNIAPPDTAAPTITITEPANNSTVTGNRTKIAVQASDTSGVASITIAINGEVATTCTNSTSCSFNWSTRGLANGTYTITATAQDTTIPTPNIGSESITVNIGGGDTGGGGGGNNKGGGPKKNQ